MTLVAVSSEEPSIVMRIAEAIAGARGEPVDSLEPLATHFDPEALECFIQSATVATETTIELDDCTVVITSDGDVIARSGDGSL